MPSLYHLYVGEGEASPSWQVKTTLLPVVAEVGILHKGIDGGTAGQNISFSAGLHKYSDTQSLLVCINSTQRSPYHSISNSMVVM